MTTQDKQDVLNLLRQRLNIYAGTNLQSIAWDVDPSLKDDWLDPWLTKIAVLVGSVSAIEYSSGFVDVSDDGDSYVGSLIAFTSTAIVRGSFAADGTGRQLRPVGTVTSQPRRDAIKAEILRVTPLTLTAPQDWPKALVVDVTMADNSSFTLPFLPKNATQADPLLIDFVPGLLV